MQWPTVDQSKRPVQGSIIKSFDVSGLCFIQILRVKDGKFATTRLFHFASIGNQ